MSKEQLKECRGTMTELEQARANLIESLRSNGWANSNAEHVVDSLISLANQEQSEVDAKIAENPGCMTSGQSPLDEWCRKCSAAIRANARQSSPVKESGE